MIRSLSISSRLERLRRATLSRRAATRGEVDDLTVTPRFAGIVAVNNRRRQNA